MRLVDATFDFEREPRAYHARNIRPAEVIQDFRRSCKPVMELKFTKHEYRDCSSCRATFANAIRAMGLGHLRVTSKNGRVYLINDSVRYPEHYDIGENAASTDQTEGGGENEP